MTDVTGATISGIVLGLVVGLLLQQLGFVALTSLLGTILLLGVAMLVGGLGAGLAARARHR